MVDGPEQKQDVLLDSAETIVTSRKTCPICNAEAGTGSRYCPNDGAFIGEPDRSGEVLAGKYEFIELVGEGGMSSIYKAMHKDLRRTVAVKLLHSRFLSSEGLLRFKREAHTVASLKHSGIVNVHDYGQDNNGEPYIVMDFIEGESLAAILKGCGCMPVDHAIRITIECCHALAHAHSKNIFHRDIKPSNIMLAQGEDGDLHPRIIDFGIAKVYEDEGGALTKTGELIGTARYMSPEQCRGLPPTARSDMYSLGCVFYEMLTGKAPFVGENQMEVIFKQLNEDPPSLGSQQCQKIPQGLEEILMSMMAKDPEARPTDLKTLAESLMKVKENPIVEPGLTGLKLTKKFPAQTQKFSKTLWSNVRLVTWLATIAVCMFVFSSKSDELRRSVEQLEKNSAATTEQWKPSLHGEQINDNYMKTFVKSAENLRSFDMSDAKVTDEGLACLSGQTNLERLALNRVPVTRDRLKQILKLPKLTALSLVSCGLTDQDVSVFTESKLQMLILDKNSISDRAIDTIATMPNLEQLAVSNTLITDDGVKRLANAKKLVAISLYGTTTHDDSIKTLAALPKLETLDLEKTGVTDASLPLMAKMPTLKLLSLDGTAVTPAGLSQLANSRSLELLVLNRTKVSPAALGDLSRIKSLKHLRLADTSLGDDSVSKLAQFQNLERLVLSSNNFTDAAVPGLSKLTGLKYLVLDHSKLTPKALSTLKKNLPKCRVVY